MRPSAGAFIGVLALLGLTGACSGAGSPSLEVFRAASSRAAATAESVVIGDEGWLFLRSELESCADDRAWTKAGRASDGTTAPSPSAALADFSRQLSDRGIVLLLVPVPSKAALNADRLPGHAEGLDARIAPAVHGPVIEALESAGVKALDLEPVMSSLRARGGEPFLRTDTHWSPEAVATAGAAIAREVAAILGEPLPAEKWPSRQERRVIRGDLAAMAGADAGTEEISISVVRPPQGLSVMDPSSPVLLVGDSHCLVFHSEGELHGPGAGIPDHLAASLGRGVDMVASRGADGTSPRLALARRAAKDTGWLAGKKVVVMVLAARAATGSANGWPLIPITTSSP